MLVEYVTNDYYERFHNLAIIATEKHTLVFYVATKSMEREI